MSGSRGDRIKEAYRNHRSRAKWRGVGFLLTFDEWWSIWEASGKWPLRGTRSAQYCMSRHGDVGPYAVGNVSIKTNKENARENISIGKPSTCRHSEMVLLVSRALGRVDNLSDFGRRFGLPRANLARLKNGQFGAHMRTLLPVIDALNLEFPDGPI